MCGEGRRILEDNYCPELEKEVGSLEEDGALGKRQA